MISGTMAGVAAAGVGASAVAAGIVCLRILVQGLVHLIRERGRRRTITEAAEALRGGGVVIQSNGVDKLMIARPVAAPFAATPDPATWSAAAAAPPPLRRLRGHHSRTLPQREVSR